MRRISSCPFPTARRTPNHFCLRVWALTRKLAFRHQTLPFLQLRRRSSSFVLSRRRHSRARLPMLSNQIRFQLEALSGNCWRTSTDTERVSKRLHQADCPREFHLVPDRHLHELAWLIDCFPPHPVETLVDRTTLSLSLPLSHSLPPSPTLPLFLPSPLSPLLLHPSLTLCLLLSEVRDRTIEMGAGLLHTA